MECSLNLLPQVANIIYLVCSNSYGTHCEGNVEKEVDEYAGPGCAPVLNQLKFMDGVFLLGPSHIAKQLNYL